jgi:YegS/Rv2252/BmrU family lipid kinase
MRQVYRQNRINFVAVVLHIIYNPVAGKGRARHAIGEALEFLSNHQLRYTLLTTERQGHATELAAAVPPGATVVAVGGDGTVHEVVKGLLQGGQPHDPALGRKLAVIPVGSGDDFAFALGISRFDLTAALRRLLSPCCVRVDIGMVDGEPFANSTGVGFDAEAAYRVRTSPKLFKGLAAYLYGVLTALGRLKAVGVRVVIDGQLVFEGPSLLVSLQNGPRGGGNFLFSPNARNDDARGPASAQAFSISYTVSF